MRRKYLSSSQLWLGCMCSLATLSEPTWGSPIVYANSVAWGAEPAISSSRFMPGVIFGAVLPDYRTKGTGWLVLASGVGDDSGTDRRGVEIIPHGFDFEYEALSVADARLLAHALHAAADAAEES